MPAGRVTRMPERSGALRHDGGMTMIRSGILGHDNGTASVRLRLGKLVDKGDGTRVWDMTTEGPFEIVCPGCGDDPSRDWSNFRRSCAPSAACTAPRKRRRPRSWTTW